MVAGRQQPAVLLVAAMVGIIAFAPVVLAPVLTIGCGAVLGLDPLEYDPIITAPDRDATSDACANILYVSPSGNDASTGCSPRVPKATITAAIAAVKATGATTASWEIHVCRGTYKAALSIDSPMSLLGGYDCTTWMRTPAYGLTGFDASSGRATGFDRANETRVEGTDGAFPTLLVTGEAITRAVRIDGLSLLGLSGGFGEAVRVTRAAAPTLTNNEIIGAATNTGTAGTLQGLIFASTGLHISDLAAPDVSRNRIHGGGGVAANASGSCGVFIVDAGPTTLVHENEIDGGTGRAAPLGLNVSALGVATFGSTELVGANAIARNHVFFAGKAMGSDAAVPGFSSAGFSLVGPKRVDVVDNFIIGGTQECTTANCVGVGIRMFGGGVAARNRIFAGTAGTGAGSTTVATRGIEIASGGQAIDNFVHAGSNVSYPTGVWAFQMAGVKMLHNTVFAGGGVATGGQALFVAQSSDVEVANNIVLTGPTMPSYGLHVCDTSNLRTLNNAFATPVIVREYLAPGCQAPFEATTLGAAEARLQGYGAATGNTVVTGCSPTDGCGPNIFGSWTVATHGQTELLDVVGWKLKPNGRCALAQGALALTPPITLDHFSTPRTAPASIGAHEDDGACTP